MSCRGLDARSGFSGRDRLATGTLGQNAAWDSIRWGAPARQQAPWAAESARVLHCAAHPCAAARPRAMARPEAHLATAPYRRWRILRGCCGVRRRGHQGHPAAPLIAPAGAPPREALDRVCACSIWARAREPFCSRSSSRRHVCRAVVWPAARGDKASASGAGESRLESWAGHCARHAATSALWGMRLGHGRRTPLRGRGPACSRKAPVQAWGRARPVFECAYHPSPPDHQGGIPARPPPFPPAARLSFPQSSHGPLPHAVECTAKCAKPRDRLSTATTHDASRPLAAFASCLIDVGPCQTTR